MTLSGSTGRLSLGHVTVEGPTMCCLSVGGGGENETAAWCVSRPSAVVLRDGARRLGRALGLGIGGRTNVDLLH
jgi:hypothetical protein